MFITFEGIDGAGKSTQARLFADWLGRRRDIPPVLTREPGGWDGGGALRDIVICGSLRHTWSEPFLFMLDRAEHAARVIEPALAAGHDVICERYHDSMLAYQVWGRGLPFNILSPLLRAAGLPIPDSTVLFDILPEEALQRIGKRGSADSFEREGFSFMQRIRKGYLELAACEPDRWIVIECAGWGVDRTFSALLTALEERGVTSAR